MMGLVLKLDTYLTNHHFTRTKVDSNIYTKPYDKGQLVVVVVYVDDCIVVNTYLHHILVLNQLLKQECMTKGLTTLIIKTRSCKLKINCQSANIEEEEELLVYS